MRFVLLLACAALPVLSTAEGPIETVVTLLDNMIDDAEQSRSEEEHEYQNMAEHCNDETDEKTTSLTELGEEITSLSDSLDADAQEIADQTVEIQNATNTIDSSTGERTETEKNWSKRRQFLESRRADLADGSTSVANALEAVQSHAPSFVQLNTYLSEARSMADALGLNPRESYDGHNDNIIQILQDIKKEFNAALERAKSALEEEGAIYESKMTQLSNAISDAKAAKEAAEIARTGAQESKGENLESLRDAKENLDEDNAYLASLTKMCENEAKNFDHNSDMRKNEVAAIEKAKDILGTIIGPSFFLQLSKPDPFLKVKKMIQTLIFNLAEEQKNANNSHGDCTAQLANAKSDMESRKEELDVLNTSVDVTTAQRDEDKLRCKKKSKVLIQVGEKLEAHNQESRNLRVHLDKTIDTCRSDKSALESGIKVLRDFYRNSGESVAIEEVSNADVRDSADHKSIKSGEATYHGNKSRAENIMQLLEQILDDTTENCESLSQQRKDTTRDNRVLQGDLEAEKNGTSDAKRTSCNSASENEKRLTELTALRDDTKTSLNKCKENYTFFKQKCLGQQLSQAQAKAQFDRRQKNMEKDIEGLRSALNALKPE